MTLFFYCTIKIERIIFLSSSDGTYYILSNKQSGVQQAQKWGLKIILHFLFISIR